VRRIQLTERQLAKVISTIVAEGTSTSSVKPAGDAGKKDVDKGKDPGKTIDTFQGSSNIGTGSPINVPTSNPSGTIQTTSGGQTPNTGGGSYAPLFQNVTDANNTHERMYDLNISLKAAPDFKGPNNQYIPGAGDEDAQLQMKDSFGIEGVTLDTMGGDYDIKVGDKFIKDMKKGKLPKKSKIKHANLHPTRHSTKARSKNITHADGITRGGVTFDTKFKPGLGADPYTVKTS
tara:strand:+ start:981 stop:1679 length:699 start_codon:yes stop_codon:yes gene_type:complete